MADEITQETTDPRAEHAAHRLEQVTQKLGIQDSEPEPQETTQPSMELPLSASEESKPHPAHQQWQERRSRQIERIREQERERLYEELAGSLRALEGRLNANEGAAGAKLEEVPPPVFADDPDKWLEYMFDQRLAGLTKAIDEKLGPVVDYVRHSTETQQQYQERVHREQQEAQRVEAITVELRESQRMYESTPEGQGFRQRLAAWAGHPGDPARGIPPDIGAMARSIVVASDGAINQQEAAWMALQNRRALTEIALSRGLNPSRFLDGIMRSELQAEAPKNPKAAAAQREIREMTATAKASGVAGSVSQSGKRNPGSPMAQAAKSSRTSPDALMEVIKDQYGGDLKKGLRHFRKLVAEARENG